MNSEKAEVVVPEEATERGPILKGELKSSELCISDILTQYEKIVPKTKRAKVYFYPTVEQAKALYRARSPFAFKGSWNPRDGEKEHWTSTEIWLSPIALISYQEMRCLTFCSGRPTDLHIKTILEGQQSPANQREFPKAWLVTNRCFLLQILATHEEEPWSATESRIKRSEEHTSELQSHSFIS